MKDVLYAKLAHTTFKSSSATAPVDEDFYFILYELGISESNLLDFFCNKLM